MSIRKDCPRPGYEEFYIELPDEWLGEHSYKHDRARDRTKGEESETLKTFALAMSLLDDWRLPGLEGNPDTWDFSKLPLSVIGWVNGVVMPSYYSCFIFPKVPPSPSQNGQPETVTAGVGS